MAVSIEELTGRLSDSGLLPPDEVSAIRQDLGPHADVASLINTLVTRNRMTAYQTRVLLEGTSDPLVLGDYIILDTIGQGGMGKVYKAEHRRMERVISLKLLPPELTKNEEAIRRFEREIKAAAKLSHPNIMTAYDAGVDRGTHYLICEFIDGQDLSAVIKQHGPLEVRAAVDYVLQTARGLEYAHAQGVVHRDIKPSNLMLDYAGHVKILDLGLARFSSLGGVEKMAGGESRLTETGQVMGTVDYMAPEQAVDPRTVDCRADIYSLGCTLYYFLSGRPPFPDGTAFERLFAHQQSLVPSIASHRNDVPVELEVVLMQMVAKNVAERFASMSDVIRALEAIEMPEGVGLRIGPTRIMDLQDEGYRDDTVTSDTNLIDEQSVTTLRDSSQDVDQTREETLFAGGSPNRRWMILCAIALAIVAVPFLWEYFRGSNPSVAQPRLTLTSDPKNTEPVEPGRLTSPATVEQARAAQLRWANFVNQPAEGAEFQGISFALIPPGEYRMGFSGQKDAPQLGPEPPANILDPRVELAKIDRPFYCSRHEISRRQFREVMGYDPSMSLDLDEDEDLDARPVESVTWEETIRFCNALSEKNGLDKFYRIEPGRIRKAGGLGYRLPTEVEWEYACRAGSDSPFYFGKSDADLILNGWCAVNAANQTHSVGTKLPNALGLYDMHGNVWEWCDDDSDVNKEPALKFEPNRRVVRGGSWMHLAEYCSASCRLFYNMTDSGPSGGFRIVRTIDPALAVR